MLGLKATAGPADTEVAATGIGINRATFYPVVDGYLDTVTLRGTRNEKASVAVGIYAPTGGKVRTLTAASALGAYAIAWNGKTASGAVVPAGRYRVVQTVTDLWGNHLAVTSYVNVSRKKLFTYTYVKTLNGAAYSATGDAGTGSISKAKSSYADGVRIATGHQGSAGVGYAFTVPAATIYKSVKFEMLGRSNLVAGAGDEVGVQDWSICTGWDDLVCRQVERRPGGLCMGRDQGAGHPSRVVDASRPRVRGGVDLRRLDHQVGRHPRRPRHGGVRDPQVTEAART